MITFLMLPTIAWEDFSTWKSFRKGIKILRAVKKDFLAAYGTTKIFAMLVMIVRALFNYLNTKPELNLPEIFWYAALIYMAFAASFTLRLNSFVLHSFIYGICHGKKKRTEQNAYKIKRLKSTVFF